MRAPLGVIVFGVGGLLCQDLSADDSRCSLTDHFESIPLTEPARNCLRRPIREWTELESEDPQLGTGRPLINQLVMPAVCRVRIPERLVNDSAQPAIAHAMTHQISVSGTGSWQLKVDLALELGLEVGISPQLQVAASAAYTYSWTTTSTTTLTIVQDDCYTKRWDMFARTGKATGSRTVVHFVEWELQSVGTDTFKCEGGIYTTRCNAASVQGAANTCQSTELEYHLTPCCGGSIFSSCRHPHDEMPGTCCCRIIH